MVAQNRWSCYAYLLKTKNISIFMSSSMRLLRFELNHIPSIDYSISPLLPLSSLLIIFVFCLLATSECFFMSFA